MYSKQLKDLTAENMAINEDKKNIALTKKQFLTLLKTVYLGNWMANAQRTGQNGDPRLCEYQDMSDYLFFLAPQFGFSKNIEHELEFDKSDEPTEVSRLHEEYDEETFWDELCERLGERDFHRKYPPEQIRKMSRDEYFIKLQECIIAWEEEAEEHGVERLEIMKTLKELVKM